MAGLFTTLWWRLSGAANDPARFLAMFTTAPSERKRRLLAVACCRAVRSELDSFALYLNESGMLDLAYDTDAILALAEGIADGLRELTELNEAHQRCLDAEGFFRGGAQEVPMFRRLLLKARLLTATTDTVIDFPLPFISNQVQCDLARDIFGNPFRPVTFSPSWRSDTAVSLARGMYESRDFSAMPILADALQDAGCDNDDMLSHCRALGEHVRGCWVVDLVLDKE